MQGPRALIAVAALVAVVALFFVLRDADDDEPATTAPTSTSAQTTTAETTSEETGGRGGQGDGDEEAQNAGDAAEQIATIVVKGGEPVDGVQELSFTEGEQIRFEVESDVADEVHLHGYDVTEDVPAGGSVKFDLPATIPGVFEAELHHAVVVIAEITVNPA